MGAVLTLPRTTVPAHHIKVFTCELSGEQKEIVASGVFFARQDGTLLIKDGDRQTLLARNQWEYIEYPE